ncbi:MAG TPA: S24 family peptidase [Chloroflexia bacterium]|nr:S24 family peptidase [Chloroflexia bacterium]
MVIRLPGFSPQRGPQAGPNPAWARFTRTVAAPPDWVSSVSLKAFKPEVEAYRVLGGEPTLSDEHQTRPERNKHNSSVYVSSVERQRGKPAASVSRLPVIGEIAAGQYDVTVAYQEYDCLDYEGGVLVEKALARGGSYALRVRGTSMTHVGIEPGDVVIVRPQNWADDGDFVVAGFTAGDAAGAEGLATLKRFYKRRDHIFLQSATASTDPIRIFPGRREGDRDPVGVQGVGTMVLKCDA